MTTEWAHLPNAAHLDRVIASVKAHPVYWVVARNEVRKYTAREDGREAAYDAVRDAVLVLCAYDDCAHMLDSDPGELAILAAFGVPCAGLLPPTCKAFHSSKTIA